MEATSKVTQLSSGQQGFDPILPDYLSRALLLIATQFCFVFED